MKPDQQQQQDDETQNPEIPNESKPPPPSSSSSSPPRKKTRDLPTLSECHACKFRIDIADGKTKLHTLYSEWRIVLLCKKCFASVEASEICSYCFGSVSEDDFCFTCSDCNRRVHRDCFSEYKTFASQSHSSCLGGSEKVSVCMDCWIPKPLASWRGVVLSDRNGKRKRRSGSESGISFSDNGDPERVLEDVVKDANSMAEKKIEAAAKAREKAARKAAVANRAIEVATNALGFVAKIDERDGSVDDSQLAFELHRAINGSPRRISKNLCPVNLAWLAAPKGCWECDGGDQFIRATCSANESACGRPDSCSYGEAFEENRDKNVSEAWDLSLKEGEGSCSMKTINLGGDDNGMDFESLSFCKEEEESIEQNSTRCDAKKPDCNLFKYYQRRRKKKTDRYFLKYSKRKTRLKAIPPQASA